jgi:SAM-dependent methyltransferase
MLDLGCASGATMFSWIDAGWNCKGVDPHRPSVEMAKNYLKLNVSVGAGEELPFDDNSFDLILCLGPHEHAYDLNRMFNETRRTLNEGGYLMIRWRSAKIFGSPLEYYNHNHYRFFTPNMWRLILRKHGFTLVDATQEKLEGWQSYEYILARKDLDPSEDAVHKMISSGIKDDLKDELKKIQFLRKDYYDRCKDFLDLTVRYEGNEEDIMHAISNGDKRWVFLTEVPDLRVPRSVMEAERYVAEYEAGHIR